MDQRAEHVRIAVVGAGNVGATFAYALLLSGLATEIVLIDEIDPAKAEGEAMDLSHAVPFTFPTRVWNGGMTDCAGAVVTVIAAGPHQDPAQAELAKAADNVGLIAGIAEQIARHNPEGIILVVTEPVDVMTYVALEASGLPARQVIGSGTVLDTARFRDLLGAHMGVDSHSVHAYVIGVHGESAVPVWSLANVGGMHIGNASAGLGVAGDRATLGDVFRRTRQAATDIIERKGATYYALALGLVRIVHAIVRDESSVLCVSARIDGAYAIQGVCLSLPTVINRKGADRVLYLSLSSEELAALREAASAVRAVIERLPLPAAASLPEREPAATAAGAGIPTQIIR